MLCYYGVVECPRCQVELVENHCPKCGYELPVKKQSEEVGKPEAGSGAIEFSAASSPEKPRLKDANWRSELKRKLDRHRKGVVSPPSSSGPPKAAKKSGPTSAVPSPRRTAPTASAPNKAEGKGPDPAEKEIVRQLFRYRMGDKPAKMPDRIVNFRQKDKQDSPTTPSGGEKPLIRRPLKSRRQTQNHPDRDLLPLGKLPEYTPATSASTVAPETGPTLTGEKVSNEILLSRFLCGIIDLGLAVLGGVICALVASAIVGVPYYSPDVLGLVILCAILLFFLNSVFFLVLLARTPGMMWTDLRLVEEERGHPTPGAVLLRTLLFLPLAASVVGLVWALFDEQRRCWHDQLSGTRVVADSDSQ